MLGGYADFLYQTGLVDELQRAYVLQQTDTGVRFIQQQKWVEAFEVHRGTHAHTAGGSGHTAQP